jgi:hypothetical protein
MIVCNCLTCYSGFKPKAPTEKHIQAMLTSLSSRPVFVQDQTFRTRIRVPEIKPMEEISPLAFYSGKKSVRSPVFGGGSVAQNEHLELELDWLKDRSNQWCFLMYHDFYRPIIEGFSVPRVKYGSGLPIEMPEGGRLIPLTKDGGWKVRWIASPYRLHQMALKPLGKRLYDVLRSLPWDCTFNQDKAIPILQEQLRKGTTVHSVDLKDATDQFPLNFQLSLLRQFCSGPMWQKSLDLFRDLSRSKWIWSGKELRWQKGQPMGLYPSFPSLAVSHGLLLKHLCPSEEFLILGDDVVIWNTAAYQKYMSTLHSWNVPVSKNKCISSNCICEFAGAVITADSVFRNFKWKTIDDENFLDMMRQFGKRYERALTWRQRRVYRAVADLQPPLGLAHGVTDMVSSVRRTEEFEKVEVERGSRVLGFFRWLGSHLGLQDSISLYGLQNLQRTFDKKVCEAVDKTVFRKMRGDLHHLKDHLRAVRLEPDTPYLDIGESTPSTLILYEQKLGFRKSRTQRSTVPPSNRLPIK